MASNFSEVVLEQFTAPLIALVQILHQTFLPPMSLQNEWQIFLFFTILKCNSL